MPFGPGSVANGGGALAGPALQRQGIKEPGVDAPMATGDPRALSEAMKMLRGGQVGADRFMAVLELLAGQILPQVGQGQPSQPQAPASIRDVLG